MGSWKWVGGCCLGSNTPVGRWPGEFSVPMLLKWCFVSSCIDKTLFFICFIAFCKILLWATIPLKRPHLKPSCGKLVKLPAHTNANVFSCFCLEIGGQWSIHLGPF